MAIYRFSAQVIGRSAGRAVTAAAAYRAGERLRDDRTGIEFDYRRRHGVAHAEILAPSVAPAWVFDRAALWNAVEGVERRRDAQLAREIQLALPCELSHGERVDLVRNFANENFVKHGMVADVTLHSAPWKGDDRNEHAHVLLTTRVLSGVGFGPKERAWNDKAMLGDWRENWAREVNLALDRAGKVARVDHRTLEAQRDEMAASADSAREQGRFEVAAELAAKAVSLDREPVPKMGPIAKALEVRGAESERGNRWRDVLARNAERLDLGRRLADLRAQLDQMQRRMREILSERRLQLAELWQRAETALEKITRPDRDGRAETGQERAQKSRRYRDWRQDRDASRSSSHASASARRARSREDPERER